jgi:hypothetical protein
MTGEGDDICSDRKFRMAQKQPHDHRFFFKEMAETPDNKARLARVERATFGSGDQHSIL